MNCYYEFYKELFGQKAYLCIYVETFKEDYLWKEAWKAYMIEDKMKYNIELEV